MQRRAVISIVGGFLVVLIIGIMIGSQLRHSAPISDGNGKIPAIPEPTHRRFAMSVVVSGVPFWTETRKTWAKLANSQPNTETLFGGPTNTDAQRHAEELDFLLAKSMDGLVIAPPDSKSLTFKVNDFVSKGTPVITYLVDLPESKRLTYITSELDSAGEKIGTFVAEQVSERGNAIILYAQAGNDEQEARARGIRTAINRFPNMRVLTSIEDKYDESVAAEQLKPLLTQHKDVTAILGCNSRSAIGAVIALKELGYKPGEIIISGWDFDNELVGSIEEGWVQASIAQNTEFMTYLAFEILSSYVDGTLQPNNDKRVFGKRNIIPNQIIVPVTLITKENCSDYRREE